VKLMRIVLENIPNVTFYFDNILVYSTTWEEHIIALRRVFQRLVEHKLTAKPSKCKFAYPSVDYLGFVIGPNGALRPQHDKLIAIQNMLPPTTKTALRSFIGFTQFYKKFVPNQGTLKAPLSAMLKDKVHEPLKWSDEAIRCFEEIKKCLCSEPILKLPDLSKPFVLSTDASNSGIAAILSQYYEDKAHPVSYAGRQLNSAELNYSTIEKETLAIVYGIDKFKYYLLGKEFILQTDHKPLIYLHKAKHLSGRLTRWSLALQEYKYRIVHVAGELNNGPDLISRTEYKV
jgi:hypothetical protein